MAGKIQSISLGGACAWGLPPGAGGAGLCRSLVRDAMVALGLDGELVDSAELAASEVATNAFRHAPPADAHVPPVPPELWLWARASPAPELMVTVFDARRDRWPAKASGDPLDEGGKGLGIVAAVASDWGAHLTRSRMGRVPGKGVWCSFRLPGPWPDPDLCVAPDRAARQLAGTLAARGVGGVRRRDGRSVSLVTVPLAGRDFVNVWVEPKTFAFPGADGTRLHRPLVDLHDVAEHLVRQVEEAGYSAM